MDKIRAAAYCRVSTDMEEQEDSYELQVSYFTERISNDPEMELVGIYGDDGRSGLRMANRPGLQNLLADCRSGKIDLVMMKSLARFARNMSECVAIVRELRGLGVDLYFEKENINTLDSRSDFLLEIFAAIAEEESHSISRNLIMAHEQHAREGRPFGGIAYGYRNAGDNHWEINEEQAPLVRKAFLMASQGKSYAEIRGELNRMKKPDERSWNQARLKRMLTNVVYKGDYFSHASISIIPGKSVKNKGYRDRYYIDEHHEPIVSPELFDAVQKIIERGILISYRQLSDEDMEFLNEHEPTGACIERQERQVRGGIVPFGYVRTEGKLSVDPAKASIVKQMFLKAKEGIHAPEIASWLEEAGIKSPRGSSRWSDTTVRDILKNDVYTDDLISGELYDAVQGQFHKRAPMSKREPGEYQRLVFCGNCGRQMIYHGAGGRDRRKTAVYACLHHTGRHPKGQPLDHMPTVKEKELKAEVAKQSHQKRDERVRSITVYPDGEIKVQFDAE